jgi:hypothetical protein
MNLLGRATDPAFWAEVREKDCYKKFREEQHQLWETYGDAVPLLALR